MYSASFQRAGRWILGGRVDLVQFAGTSGRAKAIVRLDCVLHHVNGYAYVREAYLNLF